MKNLTVLAMVVLIVFSCKEKTKTTFEENADSAVAEMPKTDTEQEWTILFDGSSFDAWKEYNTDGVSENWKIENGAMVFYPTEKYEAHNLVTKKEYTDFILSLEWKISEGGNSGIFWGVQENPKLSEAYQTGPEIQVLDNEKHPDAKAGLNHQAGALYDMVAPSKDATKPVGEWNSCIITIDHKEQKGSVNLNGTEVVTFPVGNEKWDEMVSKSKFADWEHFGKYDTGKIGLQDHGNRVSFRNIKIKEL
ncbi:DUF1080 domain-containing protein [Maribacter sp. 2210JD10-5]|uniref:3-keto-disaccharide hydrolase n=1 Tax=Maribacter sp. 2210JD10-5 TaxID=3386272 RepID=UPI0039BD3102